MAVNVNGSDKSLPVDESTVTGGKIRKFSCLQRV